MLCTSARKTEGTKHETSTLLLLLLSMLLRDLALLRALHLHPGPISDDDTRMLNPVTCTEHRPWAEVGRGPEPHRP